MTQQTDGMPELKYSEEAFAQMYEAGLYAKALIEEIMTGVLIPKELASMVLESLGEALDKAEGGSGSI